jgi:hypothetical protein
MHTIYEKMQEFGLLYHFLLTMCRGQPYGSPNNREKRPFQKIIKRKQTYPQTPKHALRSCNPGQTRAHDPRSRNGPPTDRPRYPSGESPSRSRTGHRAAESPPRSRAWHPLGRVSASLEGLTPPRAILCLARGTDAPSGGSPPRSRPP